MSVIYTFINQEEGKIKKKTGDGSRVMGKRLTLYGLSYHP